MLNPELGQKLSKSWSELHSTVSTNSTNRSDVVWWSSQKIPDKLYTCPHTMIRVYPRYNKSTTVINSIILYLWSCLSKWETDIKLYFLSWYLKTISLEFLSSLVLCISSITYCVSFEYSVYGRLIYLLSCYALYPPCKLSCSHLWHLMSQSTYFCFEFTRSFVVYSKSHTSIRESLWFWSWTGRDKSVLTIQPIPRYPLGYTLTRHIKALCYRCNRSFLCEYILYCLYLH